MRTRTIEIISEKITSRKLRNLSNQYDLVICHQCEITPSTTYEKMNPNHKCRFEFTACTFKNFKTRVMSRK